MVKASSNHETTAVLKEKIEVLREEDKDKGIIIIKSLLRNENIFLRSKNDKSIQLIMT